MIDQDLLARPVAVEHRPHLRDGGVRFVDHQQIVVGEIVNQGVRLGPRRRAVEMAGVVLDARAVAHLLNHLDVVAGAGSQALGFEQFAVPLELHQPLFQLGLDARHRGCDAVLGHDVMDGGEHEQPVLRCKHFARCRIDKIQAFDLVAEHLDAVGELLIRGPQLDHVAAHAKTPALEGHVVALILQIHEPPQQLVAFDLVTHRQRDHARLVRVGRTQPEDARHAGHDDHVAPRNQRTGRAQPQPIEIVVARGVFFDVDVALGNVRFRLIVVVIADEILDGIVGKKLAKLLVKLGGERLVVGDDQRRSIQPGDHVGHRKGLARTGHAQ
jgi:hypothetical protein